ncbi:nitrogen assimilation response regulator NtrX [Oceanibacterium hippocampi]|uniref:Nitrogen regulation protein NR(I) n=1 Tax=Oceanibacterium hippocampi TaxID=745714 RepID=A0A1Y5T315_9PROT|nr:sigma-54 dependent transcriptional regulator [Oceanibacterium hippocampi]SLN54679.1 Nitrogen regulation protein NR(I) [Oceanibacterium hippocampi]
MARDILIVDDEADIREIIAGILSDEGYECRMAANSDAALAEIRNRKPSLLILDIWLRGSALDGMEILEAVQRDVPDLPVIMISGHGNIETAVTAIKRGAYDFIEKPFKTERLLVLVERAIEAARLRRENMELRLHGNIDTDLLGDSSAMTQVQNGIDKVARTGSRVLITGPAGAGKEVAARRIHARSARGSGPFMVVSAANMAPERMEMELFGIEDDSPWAGQGPRIGIFERAHGGTLFVDEVVDMPLETQSKILRVLLDQTFMRVGGSQAVKVDVRVISASSKDLGAAIQEGRFREDLYHRLNVVPIRIPPLKERKEDIPALARHFLARFAESSGLPARDISEDTIAALRAYDWPGNVRQLKNLMERLLIMAPGPAQQPITADMLPPEVGTVTPAILRTEGSQEIMTLPLREAREKFEREYLKAQINRFSGNISRTASFVGMERSALHRKLKLLGISNNGRQ